MTDFEYWTDVDLRFSDLDTLGHVNNAVYVTYLEQARIGYFRDVMELGLDDLDLVVAHVEVDFRQAIRWGEEISVGTRVVELGTRSFRMGYEIRADDEVAATGETVQVALEPDGSGSRPVPGAWREAIVAYEPGL